MGKSVIHIPNTVGNAVVITGSLSGSSNNILTFEKTDGSTFDITIDTGSSTDISALNDFTSSYFLDSASFSSSISSLENWSGSIADSQGLSSVLAISTETSGSDIVVSENDVIDFRANNVSVMLFSGSEDIAYGDGNLSLRDFEIVSFTSGSGSAESKMIQLRKINNGLADLLIGNSSGVNGELSIFNSSNVITYKTETLTDSRSIYLPDSDIIWTGSVDDTVMGYDAASNKWQPTVIQFTDISDLNSFTSSYFIDSASFSSSIEALAQWSSSFIISDYLATGSFATTASNTFFGDQYVQGDITASHVLISGSDQNQLTIQGSGSLLQINSSSGESIFEVFSDQSIHMGSTDLPIKFTSKLQSIDSGSTIIYDINTSSFDGAFFEYTLKSGSNLRSGNVMSIWGNGEINYNETATVDIGDTSLFVIGMDISESYARLSGSTNSDDWVFKTLIKVM
jgi:hypothetical protein